LAKVLRHTRHIIGYFGDVIPSQSLGLVLKKLNSTQQKQATREHNDLRFSQKNIQNAKPKQTHKKAI